MNDSTILLYTAEYGQTIRARTYCSEIGDASSIKLVFKRKSDGLTAFLSATVVSNDTTYYAVDAIVSSGWLTSKAGQWAGQVEATFGSAKLYSDPFTVFIQAAPAV